MHLNCVFVTDFRLKMAMRSVSWSKIKGTGYVYRMISKALARNAEMTARSESSLSPLRRETRSLGCLTVMVLCAVEIMHPKISVSSTSSRRIGAS